MYAMLAAPAVWHGGAGMHVHCTGLPGTRKSAHQQARAQSQAFGGAAARHSRHIGHPRKLNDSIASPHLSPPLPSICNCCGRMPTCPARYTHGSMDGRVQSLPRRSAAVRARERGMASLWPLAKAIAAHLTTTTNTISCTLPETRKLMHGRPAHSHSIQAPHCPHPAYCCTCTTWIMGSHT